MTEKNNGQNNRKLLKQLLLDTRRGQEERGIAIVGMSGRYPQAETLDQFWDNISAGRDSVTEVPAERWRWQDHYDPQPHKFGKTYSRWGAFLSDVDKFDPLFFHISPAEAEGMDPQERLFLEASWQVLEDAGYTPARLTRSGNRIGVFAGVMYGDYEWLGAQAATRGVETAAHAAYWSIANRISYFLDLQGPSFVVDSACSSSLTAIHLACESLKRGECDAAIAGGVNLILHPMHFSRLSGMLSADGRCKSFGEGGNGFVGGEGVGALLLKPLDRAEKDGDRIYAVIRGSAVNAGGRTNGYTVPNPKAQTDAIAAALDAAGLSARRLSYIEAHGTGTALGDPIEIAGLVAAFRRYTHDAQFCAIGSVKSNIGHIEAAAGVAGLMKVVLQLRHRELAPSLHSETLNPALDLEATPFRIQRKREAWPEPVAIAGEQAPPRLAGISSFGGGGANAHLIVEEYIGKQGEISAGPVVITLSAKSEAALRTYAERLAGHIERRLSEAGRIDGEELRLGDLAFTLQVGREAMDERLSFVGDSLEQVRDTLRRFAASGKADGLNRGSIHADRSGFATLLEGDEGEAYRKTLIAEKKLGKLAQMWAQGFDLDWEAMHAGGTFRPISLPTYPFERKRYWIPEVPATVPVAAAAPLERDEPVPDFYFRPIWVRSNDTATEPLAPAGGVVVAARSAADLAREIARRSGAEILWLQPNNHGANSLDLFSDAGETVRLQDRVGPLDIYFLGGVQPGGVEPHDLEAVAAGQEQGLLSLFRLTRGLIQNARRDIRLKIVANDVHDCFAAPVRNGQAASMFGFAEVLATEQPDWQIASFDIALPASNSAAAQVGEWLVAEPWSVASGPVLLREGQRFTRRLEALDLPAARQSVFRKEGVYLIIGGTGGIGRLLTRHLVERYGARVIWVGRREPDATLRAEMEALRRSGGAVSFIAADAARADEVVAAVAKAKALYGVLHGVIHSAMDLQSGTIAKSDQALFHSGVAVKTDGLAALAKATVGEPLDFLALFSSSGAFGNWAGTAAYTAASAFEDAVGRQLAASRPYAVRVINWGYWGKVGSGARPGIKAMFDAKGIEAFSIDEGLDAIERIIAGPAEQVMPIRAPSDILLRMGLHPASRGQAHANQYPPLLHAVAPQFHTHTPQKEETYATWEAFDELDQIARTVLLGVFQRMGVFRLPGERHDRMVLRSQLAIRPKFHRLYDALLGIMAESGFITIRGSEISTAVDPSALPDVPGTRMAELTARKDALLARCPDIEATIQLIWIFLETYPDILQGRQSATDIMFPGSSMKLVQGFYKGNALTDWYNTLVAHAVRAFLDARLRDLGASTKIRIVELGAGTGATTERVMDAIGARSDRIEYTYTDISPAFLELGRSQLGARWGCFDFKVLNLENGLEGQGFTPASFDLVLATNVVHATKNLEQTLRTAKRLLKPNGWFVMNELTTIRAIVTIPGGVLDGWWLFEDEELRIPGSPLARPQIWRGLLSQAGFHRIDALGGNEINGKVLGQHVFVAESDGIALGERSATPRPAAQPKPTALAAPAKFVLSIETQTAHIERDIAKAVSEALRLDDVPLDRPLADYGFDSLTGVKVVNSLSELYGSKLQIETFFEFPTIRELARHFVERGIGPSLPVETRTEAQPSVKAAISVEIQIAYIEQDIAKAVKTALRLEEVSLDRPLADYGFDSLTGVKVVSSLSELYGSKLQIETFFEFPTIRELARHFVESGIGPTQSVQVQPPRLETRPALVADAGLRIAEPALPIVKTEPVPTMPREPIAATSEIAVPLSTGQRGLWAFAQIAPDSYAYNLPLAFTALVDLDPEALRRSLQKIWERHPALRARIRTEGGQPHQVFAAPDRVWFERRLLGAGSEEQHRLAVRAVMRQPFDLASGPLMKAILFERAGQHPILLLNFHHIVFDGMSIQLFLEELQGFYGAEIGGGVFAPSAPRGSYAAFVAWEQDLLNGDEGERLRRYWHEKLSGEIDALALPTDRSHPPQPSFAGDSVELELDPSLMRRLRALSGSQGTTAFSVLLAAYKLILHRYSGQTDILVGAPVAVRSGEFEDMLGYCINMAVLRSDLSGDPTFRDLVQRVKTTVMEAVAHSRYPFIRVAEEIGHRAGGGGKLLRSVFYFQNWVRPVQNVPLPLSLYPGIHQEGEFDLTFEITDEGDACRFLLKYNTDLFDEATIRRIGGHYRHILEQVVEAPDRTLSNFELVTAEEYGQLVRTWNATQTAYPHQSCLHELIDQQSLSTPDNCALRFGSDQLSYRDLMRRSTWLAGHLRELGVRPGMRVGILLSRSIDLPVALLATLKAGAAYVPLDPTYPADRLSYICGDAGLKFIVVDAASDATAFGSGEIAAIDMGVLRERMITAIAPEIPLPVIDPSNPAYVIYTSGSTGQPKGVEIPHRALTNFVCAMRATLGIAASDRLLAVTTISFDIAGLELYLPLIVGAQVDIASSDMARDGIALAAKLAKDEITILQATPATWQMLVSAGWNGRRKLKILCGGEALGQELAEQLLERSDDVWNLFGPTETTIWSSAQKLERNRSVTIGRPIANTEFYVLDPNRRLVPVGVPGELYIGGDGLARAYVNRPELTAERFVAHPFDPSGTARLYRTGDLVKYRADGEVVYLGRNDQQLKVRGFRVEAGEIEAVLHKLAFVDEVAVVLRQEHGHSQLTGFIVLKTGTALPGYEEWHDILNHMLPVHMIPAQLVALPEFPQTLNRKVDRKQLATAPLPQLEQTGSRATQEIAMPPVHASGAPSGVALPRLCTELRTIVASIVIQPEASVSLDEHFGQYGMDSIRFTELSVALDQRLGVSVGPNLFYRYSTIRRLAAHLLSAEEKLATRFADPSGEEQKKTPLAIAVAGNDAEPRISASVAPPSPREEEAVAVVGIAGMFPQCADIDAFWQALLGGRDLVTEIPAERWDWRDYQGGPDGKAVSRWGGFLPNVDQFDPHVFGISPREAEWMDPQQRLILQVVWSAVENAGQKPSDLAGSRTGVFVGVTNSDYGALVSRRRSAEGHTLTGVAHTIIANRISFQFDLRGPSEVIDTACSSSLVAVRRAVEAIRAGHCDQAFAGGVNVILSPEIYVALSKANMLSPDGRCRAFDHRANGYVRGEGAAVIMLKRLSAARADGNPIQAVIRGTAENHGGRANSLTAPNPNAQAELIIAAHRDAGIAPGTVTYMEAHGTGTALGDPIEVDGLKAAFAELQPGGSGAACGLGSVKTNIGHLEAAAGIAGLLKVILAMRHGTLPASLHFQAQNPNVDFENSGLYVVKEPTVWERLPDGQGGQIPRRAGVSSFGFGGTNAHVIVEEAPLGPVSGMVASGPYLVLLSAKREDRLTAAAQRLLAFVESPGVSEADLPAIAFTSQVGREAMEERLAFVVDRLDTLRGLLKGFIAGEHDTPFVYRGHVNARGPALDVLDGVSDTMVDVMIERRQIDGLARLWVSGVAVDFSRLYGSIRPRRIALPVYPFAPQRYWLPDDIAASDGASALAALHPFVDRNCSTLDMVTFAKHVRPDDVVLRDHKIADTPILPAVVYLEMARAAGQQARPQASVRAISNLVWLRPVSFAPGEDGGLDLSIELRRKTSGTEYQIASNADGKPVVHAQGRLVYDDEAVIVDAAGVNLAAVRERCCDRLDGAECYRRLMERDFHYGPSFQVVRELHRSVKRDEVLASIELSPAQAAELNTVILHPAIMDGALQAVSGLIGDGNGSLQLPFAAAAVTIFAQLQARCWVHARIVGDGQDGGAATYFEVAIVDETGRVLVRIDRLQLRKIAPDTAPAETQPASPAPITVGYDWAPSERYHPAAALGTVLVIADEPAAINALRDTGRAQRLVWMRPGRQFEALPDGSFIIRPTSEDDIAEAIGRLRAQQETLDRVLVMAPRQQASVEGEFTLALDRGLHTVWALSKGVARALPGKKIAILLLHGMEDEAVFGAVGGFAQTLAVENPNLSCRAVGISDIDDAAACAAIALEEFSVPGGVGSDVRHAEGKRWIKRVVPIQARGGISDGAIDFAGGPYLITGGGGALGLLFARHLIARGASSIALCGTRPLEGERAAAVATLRNGGHDIRYFQADISQPDQVRHLVEQVRASQGPILGVIHAAGLLRDGLILRQERSAVEAVLAPKVAGTLLLDEATASDPLRFFAMFSSTSARIGNPGQAAYGYANRFLTRFADQRAVLAAAGLRHGKSLALDWGLWRDGGMAPPAAALQAMEALFGMVPMDRDVGLAAFDEALSGPFTEVLLSQGNASRLVEVLQGAAQPPVRASVAVAANADVKREQPDISAVVEERLRVLFAQETKNDVEIIDLDEALEAYGLDSVLVVQLGAALEAHFGELSKTIFYEHRTLRDLAAYLVAEFPQGARAWAGETTAKGDVAPELGEQMDVAARVLTDVPFTAVSDTVPAEARGRPDADASYAGDIAVIGIAGRYPQAEDIEAFWQNLLRGENCITEIPPERWDALEDYDPERGRFGKSYSKWGGFLDDVDKFDAALFQIPGDEADWIDPQERLFLETVWALLEDAGYTARSLSALQNDRSEGVGVFVGSMYQQYPLVPADAQKGALLAASSYWSIANRVSYHFNFQGPSVAVDSACSSSMTAIHMGCLALRAGDAIVAIAGGVNLSIHRSKYQSLSLKGVIDQQDHSASLGIGSGYTPGEGVGAVMLKRLDDALRDNDRIYGVIKASGVNHSGRTHGFTVPSPHAQTDLILKTWKASGVDPRTLNYIEVAANGSNLGDPIEIGALSKAMRGFTEDRQAYPIGAVKSNIGHLEAASGISQITKVLLQLRHRTLVPSINASPHNPNLKLEDSPFFIQREVASWPPNVVDGAVLPRRAAISSFGAGGANAHLVIEEFSAAPRAYAEADGLPQLIVLSALTEERLRASAARLLAFLKARGSTERLRDIAYTLQIGRQPLAARLALAADNVAGLIASLADFCATGLPSGTLRVGVVSGPRRSSMLTPAVGIVTPEELDRLATGWVNGAGVDWEALHAGSQPGRIGLPHYPFQRDRHWVQDSAALQTAAVSGDEEPRSIAPKAIPALVATTDSIKETADMADWMETETHDDDETLLAAVRQQVMELVADVLSVSVDDIDPEVKFGEFGVDSLGFVTVGTRLNEIYDLNADPTIFFVYPTPDELARYLVTDRRDRVARVTRPDRKTPPPVAVTEQVTPVAQSATAHAAQPAAPAASPAPTPVRQRPGIGLEPVAIIGISGIFPQSPDLESFWRHLEAGHDLVTEVPADRWDWRVVAEQHAPGKTAGKWGGFVPDVDKFDADFFNMSPREAASIDPQQRLFTEVVWKAIEDAGYSPSSLAGSNTGLFAGVSNFDYIETLRETGAALDGFTMIGNSHSILANRVSYLLDLQGPSLAIDTACSSALVAVNRAIRALQTADCSLAIAGGVNLLLNPKTYIPMINSGMLSEDGRCKTFDRSANGYARGEGVGALVLKPLSAAERDGDHIYAVILGTAQNHGGRTNSLTAPNPNAQSDLIKAAWLEAGVSPSSASYIEAHGTGTPLGDPIEMNGLKKAFAELYDHWSLPKPAEPHCAIGSVKTNIGHLESGSGIAGLLKVVLGMRHGILPANLHCTDLNPYLHLENSPFFIATERREWQRLADADGKAVPRRAGISSFGFGGANAHVVIEEYESQPRREESPDQPLLFVFSARTEERLLTYLSSFAAFLRQRQDKRAVTAEASLPSLADIAFTLRIGRDAMGERLAVVAHDEAELSEHLQAILRGEMPGSAKRGSVKGKAAIATPIALDDEDARVMVTSWMRKGRLGRIAELWVNGAALDWRLMPDHDNRRRVPLPTYPFARERHWPSKIASPVEQKPFHPLIGAKTVSGEQIAFRKTFRSDDIWLRDHVIGGRPLLAAAVMLEMARAAADQARPETEPTTISDVFLLKPFEVRSGADAEARLVLRPDGDGYAFSLSAESGEGQAAPSAEGRVSFGRSNGETRPPERLDLDRIRRQCSVGIDGETCYRGFAAAGYVYGPTFQPLREIMTDPEGREAIARLVCPDLPENDALILHPALIDGALQSVGGLVGRQSRGDVLDLPFAIGQVDLLGPLPHECFVYVTASPARTAAASKAYDVAIADEHGRVAVFIREYAFRPSRPDSSHPRRNVANVESAFLLAPKWEREASVAAMEGVENVLILAGAQFGDRLLAEGGLPASWTIARAGGSFQVEGDRICTLKPDSREQQTQLLDWLASKGRSPQLVVQVAEDADLDTALADRLFGVAALVQAEMQGNRQKAIPIIHVHDDTASGASRSLSTALASFSKCLQYEMSRLTLKTLALAFTGVSARAVVDTAIGEHRNRGDAQEIHLRDGQRWVKRYAPLTAEGARQGGGFRQGGSYIVTGGLGGLGLIVAGHLARAYKAKLVLCGRSPLSDAGAVALAGLREQGAEALYVQADVAVPADAERLLAEARRRFGPIAGILHAAGILDDAPLARKSFDQMAAVLSPKIQGTINLDAASREDRLDVFVTFSSVAAVLGSPGQVDYAYGNAFMDAFAIARRQMAEKGQRFGKSLSIDWPLWAEGGMSMDERAQAVMRELTGMIPLATEAGVDALELALQSAADQVVVAQGDRRKIEATFMPAAKSPAVPEESGQARQAGRGDEQSHLETLLTDLFAKATNRPAEAFDAEERLDTYGVDSIVIVELMPVLETRYNAIAKTLFFEFQTIRDVAGHLLQAHPAESRRWLDEAVPSSSPSGQEEQTAVSPRIAPAGSADMAAFSTPGLSSGRAPGDAPDDAIAIIGLSGRYPLARNLDEFWDNLQSGRNCITRIPPERWDPSGHYDPEKGKLGKSYSMWGGFIDEIDRFDAGFFNISQEDARWIDPQERLFMEIAWETMEHAGVTQQRITELQKSSRRGIGVFVGCMYQHYSQLAKDEEISALLSTWSYWSIANRISQVLNLSGPSLAVDTASSSSLVALHMACESIRRGESIMALAGGVNLSLHPGKYKSLSQRRVIGGTDRSMSLGDGDGYVPGEGIGAVLLRPLGDAIRDGDPIQAVIRSSAMNHSGRAIGFMTPSLQAQADVIGAALEQAQVDPRTISWVEAAANGSPLGDPIEIGSLSNAFRLFTDEKQFCPIGTVKSNIGHLEAASGISQLTKVILQLRHRMLVPTLNAEPLNPNVNLQQSPFFVQKELTPWHAAKTMEEGREAEHPRRAMINSFGLGGANVIVLVEENAPREDVAAAVTNEPHLFVLSGKNSVALKRYAERYVDFLRRDGDLPLAKIAYTSQLGREAFSSRLAIVASDVTGLTQALEDWLRGEPSGHIWEGEVMRPGVPWSASATDSGGAPDWNAVAEAWVDGAVIRWAGLHRDPALRRIDLPTYPFARDRHWLTDPLPVLEQDDELALPGQDLVPSDDAVYSKHDGILK